MRKSIHADGEELEQYCLGWLSQPECESLEEHLLICASCQDRLAETELYIRAMRDAAGKIHTDKGDGSA